MGCGPPYSLRVCGHPGATAVLIPGARCLLGGDVQPPHTRIQHGASKSRSARAAVTAASEQLEEGPVSVLCSLQ